MAALAHILQIVGWWIAPLIIFFIKRESKFVSFHAMQALLWQIVFLVFYIAGFAVWFGFFIIAIPRAQRLPHDQFPVFLFLPMFAFWGVLMLMVLANLTLAIVYGIKAGRGQWADYPLLGRLARRILHMPVQPGSVPAFQTPAPQG
ncbi:MAG TPA: DUF4870 domain-containing protein [Candidatus Aquilonibacter sp.]|nr:DUF4870 domain-containing protein [Candidatus Aquilonibacter sp.]